MTQLRRALRLFFATLALLAAACGGARRGATPVAASPESTPDPVDQTVYSSGCVSAAVQRAVLECPPEARRAAVPLPRARVPRDEALGRSKAGSSSRREARDFRSLEETYRGLAETGGDEQCIHQARLADVSRHGRTKREQLEVLRHALDQMDAFVAGDHPADAEWECREAMAQAVLDRATVWHQEAAGTDTLPGTLDEGTMDAAAELYRLALERFDDMDQLGLEGWPFDSRPTRYRVTYWAAELLWRRHDWAGCAVAFDRVVDMYPRGEYLAEAAYAAVLCYNNLYEEQNASDVETRAQRRSPARRGRKRALSAEEELAAELQRLARQDLDDVEEGMLQAYTRYVCYVAEGEDLVRIKYRRARIYYVANQWEEAAVLFRDIAVNHSGDELASYAANQYLDCLNAIARLDQDRRAACRDELAAGVEGFLADPNLMRDEELRSQVSQLRCGIMWSQAEAHTEARRFREAADLYVQIYADYRDECAQIGNHDLCEVLYDAAINYEFDYRIGPAIQVRHRLLSECGDDSEYAQRHGGKASEWAKRALYQIGGNYHAIASYTKAAQYYEDYARRYAGEGEAPGALALATRFRLDLGQSEKALADARLFATHYGKSPGLDRQAAAVLFDVGAVHVRAKSWAAVKEHYQSWLERFGSRAAVGEAIGARTILGKAMIELGDPRDQTEAVLLAGLALADQDRPAQEERPDRLARYRRMLGGADGPAPEDRLARHVAAVSEARFLLGDVRRSAGKRAQAEAQYLAAVEEGSPTWTVAALSRLGDAALAGHDAADAPGPVREQAAEVYLRCLAVARAEHVDDEWSRACERQLATLDPRRYPLNDEIRAQPTFVSNPLAVPRMPRQPAIRIDDGPEY
jgi:hypothetical protein